MIVFRLPLFMALAAGAAHGTGRGWLRVLWATALGLAVNLSVQAQPPAAADAAPTTPPRVTVVLAGGGAKGFAHLAVLRRLERDGVPIHQLIGTSMGAVIGGLYASGLSVDEIERVISSLDPARIALDQIDRTELPARERAYQSQYTVGVEFGLREGRVGFARGVSDGQRFLGLLQRLTRHVPPEVSFDQLRVPFRAVATRYRDGAMKVFDRGSLPMAIRASMAAPGVFAPLDVAGEVYVDGGLVANLPVEVALREGADVIVASYLGLREDGPDEPSNALAVASRMLDILIKQNEQRSMDLLRPQDILVTTPLADVQFADFNRAAEVVAKGEQAVARQEAAFARLAAAVGGKPASTMTANSAAPAVPRLAFDEREITIAQVQVRGTVNVPAAYVQAALSDLVGQPFQAEQIGKRIDALYTGGQFEHLSYGLQQAAGRDYALVVTAREKSYGPHLLRTSVSLFTESGGDKQYAIGLGYRRGWLTSSGLELQGDLRVGTRTEFSSRLFQPLPHALGVGAFVSLSRFSQPLYPSGLSAEVMPALGLLPSDRYGTRRLTQLDARERLVGVELTREMRHGSTLRVGLQRTALDIRPDTVLNFVIPTPTGLRLGQLPSTALDYNSLKLQWLDDQLDSTTFTTRGYLINLSAERGLGQAPFRSDRINLRWATRRADHVWNLGANIGYDRTDKDCDACAPNNLYLGGFQAMGAYLVGQLSGERLVHAQATYMYRLSEGGLLRQPTYVGLVAEVGDVWTSPDRFSRKFSGTLFLGVDSKIGDIYLGVARGSQRAQNVFLQLGRRFIVR